jgi:hypothetical protein
MSNLKIPSQIARAASLSLTGSLVVVVGTVPSDLADATTGAIKLQALSSLRLQGTYTRDGGSATGRPIFAVDVSMDPPTTAAASVSNWVPVYLLDNSTFSSGRIDGFVYQFSAAPSVTGATSQGTPPFDTSGAQWARVRMADVDGAAPGAIASLTFGGEASL